MISLREDVIHNIRSKSRCSISVAGWREVWALRDISFPRFGAPDTGPVSALNLLNKKKATLAFLQVHHEDLKQAIDPAGANVYNAQETWRRVFRDAERAVLRQTTAAFPELAFFNASTKAFILWHQRGKLDVAGMRVGLTQLSSFFGDQDGLFASACNQYRTSMNEVAEWAKRQCLMDYTSAECVPIEVSLQQRDGYSGGVDLTVPLLAAYQPHAYQPDIEELFTLLSDVPLFNLLTTEERRQLARTVRRIDPGPLERIIIQGRAGSSLFLVGNGRYARFTSGGQGSYIKNGEYGEYDNRAGNPDEEEVWTLRKNFCGCWQITRFEFH